MTLTELVAAVLEAAPEEVTEQTTRQDLAEWTSLAHIKLVVALEEAYGVSLSVADIKALTGVAAARRLLADRHAAVD